ncbi:hypothetical protein G3U99_25440 (plasmid) [Vibrio coralliilyticus OCN008]|uniref:hypothetical protein n=1 Tax=Vibrio coralliilyticus TaxID=190893 RepID=UPI000390C7A2|nr:hypothetical protein [Vibrio coralliilyticus]ERB64215.1 hypothetical protein N779_16855 [Vibrio coralliilyticus OCN008]QIJ87634.1 hypothetical protein G3U99_25440 [Vibrio coralliilyticus OCN008]
MPHALLEHLDHVCHQALQHTSTQPRQLRDISNAFDTLKHQENTSCPWLETAVEYGVLSRWLQRDLPNAPTKRPPVRVGLLHGLSRQAYQLCLSRDIDRRIIQLRRRSGEKVELVAVGQAGERVNPLSQTLMHIATRGEKWFSLSNHERQLLIEALRRSG